MAKHALNIVRKHFPNVDKVVDAKSKVTVHVTRSDEKTSKRKDSEGCAMAVAVKRQMKLSGVLIARKTAYLIKGTKAIRFQVPERVTREVISFDRGGGFDPGVYALNKPDKHYALGSRRHTEGNPTQNKRHDGRTGKGALLKNRLVRTKNVRAVLGSDKE